jgi:hypothetical protein
LAEATGLIAAQPEAIYAVIANYRQGHPQIVPKPYFTKLEVEQGGVGAGTIVRVYMRVFGVDRVLRHQVLESEPGRVLVEQDMDADSATTFTVTPAEGGQTRLHIATEWAARPGVTGWLERVLTKRVLQSIYAKELRQLAAYIQQLPAAAC